MKHPWLNALIMLVVLIAGLQPSFGQAKAPAATAKSAHAAGGARTFSAQAKRGEGAYAENCAMCHAEDLKGRDPAPALTGKRFMKKWQGKSLWDLYDKVRKTMPQQDKGSLSPRTYLDIVAYMAKFNAINAGSGELKNDPKLLKSFTITGAGGKQEAAATPAPSM